MNYLGFDSQREFAAALTSASPNLPELTRGAVGNWELGKDIGIDNARRIVSYAASRDCTMSIDWIYQGTGVLTPSPKAGAGSEDEAAPGERSRLEEVLALVAALSADDRMVLANQLSARKSRGSPEKSLPARKATSGAKVK